MNLISEFEKLAAMRDRGDLTAEEFTRAKALLLNEQEGKTTLSTMPSSAVPLNNKESKQKRTQLIIASCATLTAILSAVSVILNPSGTSVGLLIMWGGLAAWNWSLYAKPTHRVQASE